MFFVSCFTGSLNLRVSCLSLHQMQPALLTAVGSAIRQLVLYDVGHLETHDLTGLAV